MGNWISIQVSASGDIEGEYATYAPDNPNEGVLCPDEHRSNAPQSHAVTPDSVYRSDNTHPTEGSSQAHRIPNSAVVRGTEASKNAFRIAIEATTSKVRHVASRVRDAVVNAVNAIKKLGITGIAREIGRWAQAHPAQAAAVAVFAIVMISTPAVLAIMGFTTSGIAAASTAAAIQSGIGNVVAGSAFAICQSAMMGGYGAVIFGALPALSAALAWACTVAWTRRNDSRTTGCEEGQSDTNTDDDMALEKLDKSAMQVAGEVVTDIGQVVKLGAIFVAATMVYRYRRWKLSRQTQND